MALGDGLPQRWLQIAPEKLASALANVKAGDAPDHPMPILPTGPSVQ